MGLTSIITSALYILSEVLVIVFIYILLIVINWQITLLLTLLLMVNAIVLIKSISKRMKKAGQKRESYEKVFFKILNSTFGNFKLIKLKGNENEIKEKFNHTSYEYSRTGTVNATLNALPKLVLEALSFSIVIIIIAYLIYSYQTDISEVLSIISVFVLGLYRLMPSVNRIITNYNNIIFKHRALEIIHNDLIYEVEDLNDEVIEFNSKITIKNLDFEYTSHRKILDNINFSIQKGESIALVGRSGSGKSTLVDIIIGLFRPSQGNIYVDGLEINNLNIKQWRKKIGYIPQSIYLFDGTVAENVAFGDSIDESKVKDSLQKANLLEFLDEYHDGIDTQVGEDGIKLSGGQKQRIAIARAMYGNPEILVLDEATSALDTDTESKIMDEIYNISKDKTLIVISHRLSTVKRCNRIFKLKDGKLRE